MPRCSVIVFEGYDTLDMTGPVEVLSRVPEIDIELYSIYGGLQKSSQNIKTMALPLPNQPSDGILLIPGGLGTRKFALDPVFISSIGSYAEKSSYVLTVCTGAALLAATSLIDGLAATTNKAAFEWVKSVRPEVAWKQSARWVQSGKYYTSSGVSAGIDMALGFVNDVYGLELAMQIAKDLEYIWNSDSNDDPFAI